MADLSFFKVNSCCTTSLKTGSIVILILNLILGLYLIGSDVIAEFRTGGFFGHFLYLGIEILGLYGLLKKRPLFILPHLVFHALFLIFFGLSLIVLLFAKSWIEEMVHEQTAQSQATTGMLTPYEKSRLSTLNSMYIYIIIVWGIVLVLEYYFFVVVLSYFLEHNVQKTQTLPAV